MDARTIQAVLIVVVCTGIVYFTHVDLRRVGVSRSTVYYWQRLMVMAVAIYLAALYTISALGAWQTIFGNSGMAMAFYRPGHLLLLTAVLIDVVYRHRSR